MCGFAVTSFFVTFAFADPIYLMAGLTTGLYAVVQAQLAEDGYTTSVATAASPRGRLTGWRVKRSQQRVTGATPLGGPA
jgi:hypothetical protein